MCRLDLHLFYVFIRCVHNYLTGFRKVIVKDLHLCSFFELKYADSCSRRSDLLHLIIFIDWLVSL